MLIWLRSSPITYGAPVTVKSSFNDNSDELYRLFLNQQPPMKIPLQMPISKIFFFFFFFFFSCIYLSLFSDCNTST
ncbi:hypothetical protein DY000_02016904 [Brassica cretica]|uniref:Uncharacterized protein n=1 Tax=Brassica cretica TaxID=69181 RepID=A0ABQ7CS96_BRACR|nr:hypothetical protein DY000_02016904 [Brassica cretica]